MAGNKACYHPIAITFYRTCKKGAIHPTTNWQTTHGQKMEKWKREGCHYHPTYTIMALSCIDRGN